MISKKLGSHVKNTEQDAESDPCSAHTQHGKEPFPLIYFNGELPRVGILMSSGSRPLHLDMRNIFITILSYSNLEVLNC